MKKIKPQHRRIADVQDILKAATADQLETPLEIRDGKYQITPELLEAYGLEIAPDGTLRDKGGQIKKGSASKLDGTTSALEVPVGEIWELLAIQATFLADANVATRTGKIYMPELGLGGVAGASPSNLYLSGITGDFIKDQFMYLNIFSHMYRYSFKNINGAQGSLDGMTGLPVYLMEGGDIQAIITANPQVTDKTGLDILYRRWWNDT